MNATASLIAPRLGRWPESGLGEADLVHLAPNLARMLRFSRRIETPPRGLDALLLEALELPPTGLPWAQSIARQRGESSLEGRLMCHRLLHIHADISNALALPLSLSGDEISILYNDLNEEFKGDCHFVERPDGDGLLRLDKPLAPRGLPHVHDLLGQPLSAWYERMREQRDWYRLHNELQMFLHLHPLNQRRLQQGQAPVNGLWCWGAEALPERPVRLQARTDDGDLQILLDHCCSNEGGGEAPKLLVWTAWVHALQCGERIDTAEALKQLDQWTAELLDLGHAVRLCTGDGATFDYRPRQRLRFWRPRFDWQRLGLAS